MHTFIMTDSNMRFIITASSSRNISMSFRTPPPAAIPPHAPTTKTMALIAGFGIFLANLLINAAAPNPPAPAPANAANKDATFLAYSAPDIFLLAIFTVSGTAKTTIAIPCVITLALIALARLFPAAAPYIGFLPAKFLIALIKFCVILYPSLFMIISDKGINDFCKPALAICADKTCVARDKPNVCNPAFAASLADSFGFFDAYNENANAVSADKPNTNVQPTAPVATSYVNDSIVPAFARLRACAAVNLPFRIIL